MLYYALGSILFAGALIAAFGTMVREFRQYRHAMMKALRNLSLDGVDTRPARPAITPAPSAPRLSPLRHAA